MKAKRRVILTITKAYEFITMSDSDTEAIEKAELVAHRRLKQKKKHVEGELTMTELVKEEKWRFVVKS
jgi:hypothetical protein